MKIFIKSKPADPRKDLDKQYARVDTGTAKNGSMVTHRYNLLWYRAESLEKFDQPMPPKKRSDKYDTRHRILIPALGADIP